MNNLNVRVFLSVLCAAAILMGFTKVQAGPVIFSQVTQVVDAKPSRAESSAFSRILVSGGYNSVIIGDDDDDKRKKESQQDGRVITETRTDIVTDDNCNCPIDHERGFPKWALLGLVAIPIAFIIIHHKKKTPTPTPFTPTPTPFTPTPTVTPFTPTPTTTPTPPVTPTPPPEPVPEPMTLLLFGTGLASIGLAARRKFGTKSTRDGEKENE